MREYRKSLQLNPKSDQITKLQNFLKLFFGWAENFLVSYNGCISSEDNINMYYIKSILNILCVYEWLKQLNRINKREKQENIKDRKEIRNWIRILVLQLINIGY